MNTGKRRTGRLTVTTYVYWFLLSYLIAALAWWFIELWQQNEAMYEIRTSTLDLQDPPHSRKMDALRDELERNRAQYIGEGVAFLVLTAAGAVFVFRSVRKGIRMKDAQQNFMMAVTHELKTPIAVTRLNLETLNRHRLDEEKRRHIIDRALQETTRLNDLCENILLSSQLDAGGFKVNSEDIDLDAALTESVHDFRTRFPERTMEAHMDSKSIVRADRLLLTLALNNLIENAIRYSPGNTTVTVTSASLGDAAEIRVSDLGPGIPREEKGRIFDRFYRMGAENRRTSKGTGLGLYLTRRIVRDLGGDIHVEDNVPMGTAFVIRLPKEKP